MREAWLGGVVAASLLWAAPGQADRDGLAAARSRARAFEAQLRAVVARVASTTVTISLRADDQDADAPAPLQAGGSGVVVDPDGFVLTNDHVLEGGAQVYVGLVDGRTLNGEVIARDEVGDLAMIRIGGRGLLAATLGDSEALRVGDYVLALGNPFGLSREDHAPAVTLGVVSGLHRYQGGSKIYGDAIQIDAAVNPGNSGGPLFDLEGRLVGINGRISIRGPSRHNVGVGFAVPSHQVELGLASMLRGDDVHRGYLGVRFGTRSDGRVGAVIREVVPGSPAATGGLQAGDRIVRVRGRAIEHPVRLQNYLSVLPANTPVEVELLRQGRRETLTVILGRREGP